MIGEPYRGGSDSTHRLIDDDFVFYSDFHAHGSILASHLWIDAWNPKNLYKNESADSAPDPRSQDRNKSATQIVPVPFRLRQLKNLRRGLSINNILKDIVLGLRARNEKERFYTD